MLPWHAIDHVLLDMDGTVLDLAFDNHFWRELVPARYAETRGISAEQARLELEPRFIETAGRLEWYCLDHWGRVTGLDLAAMKRESRERIGALPGAEDFLHRVRALGKQLWLVTNAHRGSLTVKMQQTGIEPLFDRLVSSHDYGVPKEDPRFWQRLAAEAPFDPARSLFVDDSAPVLGAARDYGIAHVRAIRWPDRSRPARAVEGFESVEALAELLPEK